MQAWTARSMRIAGAAFCFSWFALAAAGQDAGATASVAGQAVDSAGNPVAGITVMMTRAALNPGEANPGVYLATTASDGTYAITAVPPADYNLCASDNANRFVNPCVWTGPVPVPLTGGDHKSGVQIRLEAAAEVDIDVADAGQLLSSVGAKPAVHNILVGIPAPYIFLPATAAPGTPGRKHFKAHIPFDKDLQVYVNSFTLNLADAKGNDLRKAGNLIPVKVPHGQAATTVSVSVNGVASAN